MSSEVSPVVPLDYAPRKMAKRRKTVSRDGFQGSGRSL